MLWASEKSEKDELTPLPSDLLVSDAEARQKDSNHVSASSTQRRGASPQKPAELEVPLPKSWGFEPRPTHFSEKGSEAASSDDQVELSVSPWGTGEWPSASYHGDLSFRRQFLPELRAVYVKPLGGNWNRWALMGGMGVVTLVRETQVQVGWVQHSARQTLWVASWPVGIEWVWPWTSRWTQHLQFSLVPQWTWAAESPVGRSLSRGGWAWRPGWIQSWKFSSGDQLIVGAEYSREHWQQRAFSVFGLRAGLRL